MTFVHDLPAGTPDRLAIVDGPVAITYGEFDDRVRAVADALTSHGVRPGDRLLVLAENDHLMPVFIMAASRVGAWYTPLNARSSADEVEAARSHSGARAVAFTASEAAQAHAARLGAVPLDTPHGPIMVTPGVAAEPEPVPERPEERVAALMYTTGTTSTPKGVMVSHASAVWAARTTVTIRHMRPDDVTLCVLPGTHIYGFASVTLACLASGSTLRLMRRFVPADVLTALREDVTSFPGVPQMFAALLALLKQSGEPLGAPQLRTIGTGGAPLDEAWKEATERVFGLPLNNGYGLTETCSGCVVTVSEAPRKDVAVGDPMDGCEVWLEDVDEHGVGELVVRSPGVMLGYYRAPDLTARVLKDGAFRTGDLARIGPDGAVFIAGRLKELIIRSGFNVYPPEVETMLTKHPGVTVASVVGRKVPGNEEIVAFVIAEEGVTEDDLKGFLREHLTSYKVPQHIVLVDAFPTAATGKILKHKLIDHFADRLAEREPAGVA